MCGIAGELRFRHSTSLADWEHISALMARRGPDDAGGWTDGVRCTLVFRRLAILDLSPAGHQPMRTTDGRYALAFNGEVYNFRELRRRLEAGGTNFRSRSDSEVVLQALVAWGRDALKQFNGMFALAFYDLSAGRLLLARDHAGIKPLYHLQHREGLVFASQYNQLLAHPWSRALAVSTEAFGLYLRLAYIPAPYALLQNTGMLEPGTWLEATADGQVRHGRFYNFPVCSAPSLTGDDAMAAVDAAVTAAVKRQLVSDVPVGAFLSGGIDSPLVVAKMRAATSSVIRTFTVGTAGHSTDESPDAFAYARELGVESSVEHLTAEQAPAMLHDVATACSEPFGDYSIFPTLVVSRLASREFKVMLSGDGGDELFWGYIQRSDYLFRACRELVQPFWWRTMHWAGRRLLRRPGALPLAVRSVGDAYRLIHTRLSERWLARVFPGLPSWPAAYDCFAYSDLNIDRAAQWQRWNEFVSHLPMVLLKVDRASMHHSLEVRVPLLDQEVAEVAARVDWRTCIDLAARRGKLPLRRALAGHVTHQTQAKRGFEVPMAAWLRTSLRAAFEDTVLARPDLLGSPIDQKALRQLYARHLKGANYARGLWPLLSLALWAERHTVA